MGSFYVNYTVRSGDQAAVAKSLKGRKAYVTPAKDGALVVTDEAAESQDIDAVREVGELLSTSMNTQVLAVLNHDDDMLWFGLFDKGRLTDEYNSAPAYFEGGNDPPTGGDARKLCAAFGKAGKEKDLDAVLKKTDYVVAMERHADLVSALGLPDFAVGCGFNYLEEGELPEGLAAGDLVQVR
ncbi:MAG TPA: hypothetical protein VGX52_11640 [Burkholderiales bacterium]|nr:hypothetical protein [Burkholderiales bacterium]